jgi:4,5:9,10-diseco-3-hydroxy-5,9,17-trioxoandrosta-1(10),2-diene-4-oate hydrolase
MFYDSMQIPDERIEIRYPIFALRDHKQAQIALARTNIDILGVRTEVFRPIVEQLPTLIAPTLVVWGKQLCI